MWLYVTTGVHAVSPFVFYSRMAATGKVACDAHEEREGIVNPVYDDSTVDPNVSRNIMVAVYNYV